MKRPSFQFYPGDWQGNTKLRRCTHTEKGMWIDVMCLMHGSPEYGVLRWPLSDIAQAIGCRTSDLRELVCKEVLKGAEMDEICVPFVYRGYHARKYLPPVVLIPEQNGPIWYSSRMVTDEYLRQKRGNKELYKNSPNYSPDISPEYSPKVYIGEWHGDLPSSPSSSVLQNPPSQEEESTGTGTTHARGAA